MVLPVSGDEIEGLREQVRNLHQDEVKHTVSRALAARKPDSDVAPKRRSDVKKVDDGEGLQKTLAQCSFPEAWNKDMKAKQEVALAASEKVRTFMHSQGF